MKILQYEGELSANLIALFKISHNIPVNAMIIHLLNLTDHAMQIDKKKLATISKQLYAYLEEAAKLENDDTKKCWQLLKQSAVVQVSDNKFVLPSVVACSFDEKSRTVGKLEPYWYTLPHYLQQFRSLFCFIGVRDEITTPDILSVLEKCAIDVTTNPKIMWHIVENILKWLIHNFESNELQTLQEHVLVPVKSDKTTRPVLRSANKVVYLNEDLKWLRNDNAVLKSIIKDHFLVHPSITCEMAAKLQLKPLNNVIAKPEEFTFEQAGQFESLTTRLNDTLREYKDTSVIQELLQNADDAGATEAAILYDTREHDSSHLLFPGMAKSYGPALLFYNNAEFSDEDFKNIRNIAGKTKINKPLKIGKFGLGFCSVYHITDVPSFVSGENFVVFDPTLQCLQDQIRNEGSPGIIMKFYKNSLFKNSKQLFPYNGICGFHSDEKFKGTLFRFPFRKHRSKISDNVYTETQMQSMINQVQENRSGLLMFLNNVKKFSFYTSNGDTFTKQFEIVAHKDYVPSDSCLLDCRVCNTSSVCPPSEERWLIATSTRNVSSDSKEVSSIASVSTKLACGDDLEAFYVDTTIKGECFCFLPLNIETGLPVHVSSNFAVMTNRRGIWKADNVSTAMDDSKWNEMLMETVVVEAYIKLLLYLCHMQTNGSLIDYKFHSLWPNNLREVNPWKKFKDKFYDDIVSNHYSLFYSEITKCWNSIYKSKFLSEKIFERISTIDSLQSSLYHVATVLKLPVVDLPNCLWDVLCIHSKFTSQVLDEDEFIELFYCDETLLKVSIKDKTKIVTASLIAYANDWHINVMPKLMKETECIPCSPDGMKFKKPSHLLNPNSTVSKLFSHDDCMFPDEKFLQQNSLLIEALVKLELMMWLPWERVISRAKCVQSWYEINVKDGLDCLLVLIECIEKKSKSDPSKSVKQELQSVPFLPVMQKPENYPISWKGDSLSGCLMSGPKLIKVSEKTFSINAIYACGSQVAILDTQFLPQQYHRFFNSTVQNILGIQHEIKLTDVIHHFDELLSWFQSCAFDKVSDETLEIIGKMAENIYKFFNAKLPSVTIQDDFTTGSLQKSATVISKSCISKESTTDCDVLFEYLSVLHTKQCIWVGNKFLLPSCVSHLWKMNGSYLCKLPDTLVKCTALVKCLNIQDKFSTETYMKILHEMKEENRNSSLSEECQAEVKLILLEIDSSGTNEEMILPDESFTLRSAKELKYNDAQWCKADQKHLYCHECVTRRTAIDCGVELVRNILLHDLDITGGNLGGEEFGQEEDLVQRLSNILRDYPRDITFLKELLQNADDAKATKLYITLDKRMHNDKQVITEEWKELQGPALLFWNDSTFSEEDLKGIQSLGLGSKAKDAKTIGQYGIGFNVVYHFTNCPSFITNDQLCILDPYRCYVSQKKGERPGRRFKDLEELWKRFPDMKSPYLLDETPNKGSLFRLPLRQTVKHSKISSEVVSVEKLEEELKDWMSQVAEALLFLRNVCEIKLFVIEEEQSAKNLVFGYACHRDEENVKKHVVGNASLISYLVTLNYSVKENIKTDWIVQLGEGNIERGELDWNETKPHNIACVPHHGIAVPINAKSFVGKSFCYLPLPGITYLPVHVHGHFILHSDRRSLWVSSGTRNSATGSKKTYHDKKTPDYGSKKASDLRKDVFYGSSKDYSSGRKAYHYSGKKDYHGSTKVDSNESGNKNDRDMQKVFTDPKEYWNELLIEAIGVSYAYLLIDLKSRVQSPISESTLLQTYYNYFPTSNFSRPWSTLIKHLYSTLSSLNAPILIKLTNCSLLQPKSSKKSFKEIHYNVTWFKLLMPGSENECFFYTKDLSVAGVLELIGINLTDTPMFIYRQFKRIDASIKLSVVSKKSVIKYYDQFQNQILNDNKLPCVVSSTRFCNINNVIALVEYLMSENKFKLDDDHQRIDDDHQKDQKEQPDDAVSTDDCGMDVINKLGLLVTADEKLHCLLDGKRIISSSCWSLFPKSKEHFVHEDLQNNYPKDSEYLCQWEPKNRDHFNCVFSIIRCNYPFSWSGRKFTYIQDQTQNEWIKNVLNLIVEDPQFYMHCNEIINQIPLLPATDNLLYSMRSTVLPLKTTGGTFDIEQNYHTDEAKELMIKLGVPLLRHEIVGEILDSLMIQLPSVLNPQDILKTLYLIIEQNHDIYNSLNEAELTTLFTILSQVSYSNETNQSYIMQLPIFTTIQGSLVSLASLSNSTVWIWKKRKHVMLREISGLILLLAIYF